MSGNSLSNRIRKRRPFSEQPFINNLICPDFIRMSKVGFFKPCAYCEIKTVHKDVNEARRIVSCPFGFQAYNEEQEYGNELYLQRSRDV
jgi:hypothetical protein